MVTPNWDQLVLNPLFRQFGKPAWHIPGGTAEPVPITLIEKRPDEFVTINDHSIQTGTAFFEVRASELASPAKGDVIDLDGTRYVLEAPPRKQDPARLVWTLEAVPE